MRFNNWPAKSFETRWVKQRVGTIVKCFQKFIRCATEINYSIFNLQSASLPMQAVAQPLAHEHHLRIERVCAFCKNAKHAFTIFAAEIRADVHNESPFRSKMADAFQPRIDDAVRQTLVRIIQSYLHNGDLWLACPQCDKPFRVLGGRTRIAGDNICTSKAAQNPALKYPAGW